MSSTYATKTSLGNYVAIANLTTNTFITNGHIRIDNADLYYPLIDSATISSNTVATTQSSSDNSTKIATTAFVKAQSYATQTWVEAKSYATQSWVEAKGYATQSWVNAKGYATLASPTFTGTVNASTVSSYTVNLTIAKFGGRWTINDENDILVFRYIARDGTNTVQRTIDTPANR